MKTSDARQAANPRVADLVRAGKVRVGVFPPQYPKDPVTGELRSGWVEIARALATRTGVQVVLLEYPTSPEAVACLKAGACDLLFLPFDARAANVGDFSPPIFQFDYTLLVPPDSSVRSVVDADQHGVRIAAVCNHASQPFIEASRIGVRRNSRLHFRPAAHWTCGRNDFSSPNASKLFDAVAGLTGAGGPLRGQHQPDGGAEGQGRMARLCQRICRGGQGFWLGAEGHRPRWPAWDPGGPAGESHHPAVKHRVKLLEIPLL
jgi:Bacterial extracellular solute-binding proteins, family 3